MSKVPWIALAVGVGSTALAVLSGRSGSRAVLDETCGWCGGKIPLDEHVSSSEGWDFCSTRCMKKNAAEHAAEGAFDDAELRGREGMDFEDDRG